VERGSQMGIALSDLQMQAIAVKDGTWLTPTAGDADRGAESASTKAKRNAGGVNLREACNWPSRSARDHKSGLSNQHGINARPLNEVVTAWHSPVSGDSKATVYRRDRGQKGKERLALTGEARWCTPNANLAEAGTTSRSGDRKGELLLAGQCRQDQGSTNGKRGGSLNPAWVSQLMGYPDGWLDLPAETLCRLSATPSSRKSRRKSSEHGKTQS